MCADSATCQSSTGAHTCVDWKYRVTWEIQLDGCSAVEGGEVCPRICGGVYLDYLVCQGILCDHWLDDNADD